MGELIAEMAICFLATELGVPNTESLENHAAYLKNWLQAMKDDPTTFQGQPPSRQSVRLPVSFVKQPETEPKPELVEAA